MQILYKSFKGDSIVQPFYRRSVVLVIGLCIVCVVCFLTACEPLSLFGSPHATPPEHVVQANINPCALVSAQEVTHILGIPVQATRGKDNVAVGSTKSISCEYDSSINQSGNLAHASLSLVITADANAAKSAYENVKRTDQSKNSNEYQSVDGVGDSAYYHKPLLTVEKYNVLLLIDALTINNGKDQDTAASIAMEKQLALLAIKRL